MPARYLKMLNTRCSNAATGLSILMIQYNDTAALLNVSERPSFRILSLVTHPKEENLHIVVSNHTIPFDFPPHLVSALLTNSS